MRFLVDANVLSEPTKPRFAQHIELWLEVNTAEIVVDAVVMGELWRGIDALPDGRKNGVWSIGMKGCAGVFIAFHGRSKPR